MTVEIDFRFNISIVTYHTDYLCLWEIDCRFNIRIVTYHTGYL